MRLYGGGGVSDNYSWKQEPKLRRILIQDSNVDCLEQLLLSLWQKLATKNNFV